jgi:hypothetical protein
MNEEEHLKILLREVILVHMKHPDFSILKYLVEESYICEILIVKMTYYFDLIPRDIELKKYHQTTFPSDEQKEILMTLDLHDQIKLYG